MNALKRALVVSTVALIVMGIVIPAAFHPFLEGVPAWLQLFWEVVFVATLVLMLFNYHSWYSLLALGALLFTAALWISV